MKYYLNAMPKAGLHLLDALCKPLTLHDKATWAGTYSKNAWSMDRVSVEQSTNAICYLPDNHRLKGHSGYDPDLEWYIILSGVCHIFMYRDLRDVAVSQAHHILSDDDNLNHPARELYRALGSFDDVLAAVWHGIDGYPGIMERWDEYEPWLDRPNVLCLSYDDAISNLEWAADVILDYRATIKPAMALADHGVQLTSTDIVANADMMVASALDTDASPTFRRGVSGEWRQYAEVVEAWQ